jgi:ribosomal protein L16 Arg81 hydroxylase
MEVKVTRNHFDTAPKVTWEDVIEKLGNEFLNKTPTVLTENKSAGPTIICHNENLTKSLYTCMEQVGSEFDLDNYHVYISFAKSSNTFGRHKDNNHVIIVQAIGKIRYKFDNGDIHTLGPGDSLYIPKGVYHDPEVLCPRVTLSFGVKDNENDSV